jgi:hypothetical protein
VADNVTLAGKTFAADEVAIEGTTVLVPRDKIGWGAPGTYQDADATHPLPTADTAVATALATLLTELGQKLEPGDVSGLASQATLAAVLAKLSADPATQTTLAAVLTALQGTLNTNPASAGDVAGTLTNGRKSLAAAGTAEAIRAALACKWVQVTALVTNTQQVNVGGAGVLAASGTSTGTPLQPGDTLTIPVNDAAKIFVDSRVSGEGVSFVVGA